MIRRLARHTLAIFWPGCICQEQWTAYKWRKLMPQLETFSGGSGSGGEPLQSWKDLWQEHASVKIWSPQIPCHMLSLWTWTKWIEISTHRLIDQEESTSRRPQPVFFSPRDTKQAAWRIATNKVWSLSRIPVAPWRLLVIAWWNWGLGWEGSAWKIGHRMSNRIRPDDTKRHSPQ